MLKALTQNKLVKYFQEAYAELKKVTWPSQDVIRKHTILVIGITTFIAIYFGVVDYLLNLGIEYLLSL